MRARQFGSADSITKLLGCDAWIATQRFEVFERNKVRGGCDNDIVPLRNCSTRLDSSFTQPTRTWLCGVLDERKAYWQGVICFKSHSSGLYNYNRRSAATNELLSLFNLVAFNFDDQYMALSGSRPSAPPSKFSAGSLVVPWPCGF